MYRHTLVSASETCVSVLIEMVDLYEIFLRSPIWQNCGNFPSSGPDRVSIRLRRYHFRPFGHRYNCRSI